MGLLDFITKLFFNDISIPKYPYFSLYNKDGYVKVKTEDFRYIIPSEMEINGKTEKTHDIFFGLLYVKSTYIYVEKWFYEAVVKIEEDRKKLWALQNKTAELNNIGTKYEKEGNIEKAIETYEKNVSLGYTATHSYDRLCIIYRKQKDYENEIRIINLFLTNFPNTKTFEKSIEKYKTRLSKATELLTKSYKQ